MSQACSQAVGLPEIVAIILEQLGNTKDLFAALQVNKLWADEATALLWRVDTPIRALVHIEDAERLQYYADKISSLWFHRIEIEWKNHFKLQHLRFPRLDRLTMDVSGQFGDKNQQMLLQYLGPKLRSFYIAGPILNCCLMQIQARCPALHELRLYGENGAGAITANDLLRFLNGMPSLSEISLGVGLEDVITDEVFVHLASRPNLVALDSSYTFLRLSRVKAVQNTVDQPFHEMVSLECFSESKAFSELGRHLTRLTKLNLRMVDAASTTVFDLCSCTSLVSLDLTFHVHYHFPPEDLLALAKSCSHLRNFRVRPCWSGSDINDITDINDINNITDDVIQGFVALLPGLSCFRLKIKTNLTHRALEVLGEGCANLKICSLQGKFDLRLLESNGSVLFPRLEYLELQPGERCLSVAMAADILHRHAPRVEGLLTGYSWDFKAAVYKEMQELKRQDKAHSFAQLV